MRFALPLPAAIVLCLAILLAAAGARAELRVDITRGHVEPLPIALVDLAGANEADATLGRQITEVITRNLERSGLFRPIDPAAFIIEPGGMTVRPRFQDWRIINAQALVTGRVVPGDPGRLVVEFRLWDVFAEQDLVGLKLSGAREAWRSIAHTMSDKIYERLTGESGYFHTRIVYIAETGPPDLRIKRLAIMDQDGHNLRYLSDGRHLVLTPRFSPTAQEITYLSYERGVPKVYLRDIDTGQQELLGDFPRHDLRATLLAGRQSGGYDHGAEGQFGHLRDGSALAPGQAAYQQPGDRDGALLFAGRRLHRLRIRPGRQPADLYHAPRWERCAPHHVRQGSLRNPGMVSRGDLIAFTNSYRGQFSIGVMRPDGSAERILAQDYLVEGPTWAPNGRVLMFFRSSSRNPDSAELVSIDLTGRNQRILFTSTAASDPAWSPLIQ